MEDWVVNTERRLSALETKVELLSTNCKKVEELAEETYDTIQTQRTIHAERLRWLKIIGKYWHTIVLIVIPIASVIAHYLLNFFKSSSH